MPLNDAIERRRGQIEQSKENKARLAFSFAITESTGWGNFQFEEVIEFDCVFRTKPYVTHGYDLLEYDGDAVPPTRFPEANGFVTDWIQDTKGNYVGCHVAAWVRTQSPYIGAVGDEPGYRINHNFMFSGIAIKGVPHYLIDQGI